MDEETKAYLDKKFEDAEQKAEAGRLPVRQQLQRRKRIILIFSAIYAPIMLLILTALVVYTFMRVHG